jgi:hypothetical protein
MPQSQLPAVPTNSITTLFASNNFGNAGGANYFDLTVASNSITVTALDINTAETAAFTNVKVYVLPGMTSAGNEANMALWTQVATGSGTGAGLDLPTHVTLSNPFQLNAGTLYGIAVVADPAITLHYTNGNGRIKTMPTRTCPLSSDPLAMCRSPRLSSRLAYGTGRSITMSWRQATLDMQ